MKIPQIPPKIKKWSQIIIRYSALIVLLLIIDGTLGFKYAIVGFLIYVFIIPVTVMILKWNMVKSLYLKALHHLYKFITGREVWYEGMMYEGEDDFGTDEPKESKGSKKRTKGKT